MTLSEGDVHCVLVKSPVPLIVQREEPWGLALSDSQFHQQCPTVVALGINGNDLCGIKRGLKEREQTPEKQSLMRSAAVVNSPMSELSHILVIDLRSLFLYNGE